MKLNFLLIISFVICSNVLAVNIVTTNNSLEFIYENQTYSIFTSGDQLLNSPGIYSITADNSTGNRVIVLPSNSCIKNEDILGKKFPFKDDKRVSLQLDKFEYISETVYSSYTCMSMYFHYVQ